MPRGAIVGVIGPNGTGKTTLLRMIVGQEQPDAGTIELGGSVVLSYVDQHRDALDDENTVFDEITGGADRIELGKRVGQRPGLRGPVQFSQFATAEEGGRMFGRRAKPHPPGQNAPPRRQSAAVGRADQRS